MRAKRSKQTRRRFSEEFKAKVALEAIKAQETINQIAARHEVHPHQVTQMEATTAPSGACRV